DDRDRRAVRIVVGLIERPAELDQRANTGEVALRDELGGDRRTLAVAIDVLLRGEDAGHRADGRRPFVDGLDEIVGQERDALTVRLHDGDELAGALEPGPRPEREVAPQREKRRNDGER